MRILITSGTGKVGRQLTERILKRGDEPVVLSHNLEHLRDLPYGVAGIYGDFSNSKTWRHLLRKIDKVCLITPILKDEAKLGSDFAKFVCQHSLKQIVLLSIYNLEAGAHLPHFYAKLEMENVIKRCPIPYTIIRSNIFFQNDEIFLPFMEKEGLYLQPIGNVGMNRVDIRDVADAMENALYHPAHLNRSYPVIGGELLTGRKTAMIYSELFDKKISYPVNVLSLWEEHFNKTYPDWELEEYKMMYEFFLLDGFGARGDAHERRDEILGKPPRAFSTYAQELVNEYRKTSLPSKPETSAINERHQQ